MRSRTTAAFKRVGSTMFARTPLGVLLQASLKMDCIRLIATPSSVDERVSSSMTHALTRKNDTNA